MNYQHLIELALAEDLRGGKDLTSQLTIPADSVSSAEFVARKPGVVAGIQVACDVLKEVGLDEISQLVVDGAQVAAGQVIISVTGNTRKILLAERTALNFLTHLSGIATTTNAWVWAIANTKCQIRDTRKTIPGWRDLEKFAVKLGGGVNHRMGLSDAILIKDNHIAAAGSITKAIELVKDSGLEIEIEVDNIEQLQEALLQKPDLILLDNFTPAQCKEAVTIVNGAVKLEASGGITIENALKYAQTGVDYLAIGALTHSAPALDIGLDFKEGN